MRLAADYKVTGRCPQGKALNHSKYNRNPGGERLRNGHGHDVTKTVSAGAPGAACEGSETAKGLDIERILPQCRPASQVCQLEEGPRRLGGSVSDSVIMHGRLHGSSPCDACSGSVSPGGMGERGRTGTSCDRTPSQTESFTETGRPFGLPPRCLWCILWPLW